jgi:radical SAM superfamily enzyme YgiQ (UPF0313 family)
MSDRPSPRWPTLSDIGWLLFLSLDPEPGEGEGHSQTVEGLNRNAPLGLFYLAAQARALGVNCEVIDQRIEPFTPAGLALAVAQNRPRFLGLYLCDYDVLLRKAAATLRAVRRVSDVPIICGGPPVDPAPILAAGADAVALGEGEPTFADWLRFVRQEIPLSAVAGIAYRDGSAVRHSLPATPIADLDSLPFPIRKYTGRYLITGNPMMRRPVLELISNRGCPMRCAFCSSHEFWGRLRSRSVDNVIRETLELRDVAGAKYLHFRDDVFAPSRAWLDEWAPAYRERGAGLPYSVYLHPNSFRGDVEGGIRRIAASGGNMICYGLQSVDPAVLRAVDRDPDEPQRLAEHLTACRRHGIMTFVSFIVGLPGEDGSQAEATGRWLARHRPTIMLALPLQKLYGSKIAAQYPGNTPVSRLSKAQIDQLIARLTRGFYLSNLHLVRLFFQVLRRNPGWLRLAVPRLRHGLHFFQFLRRAKNW